MWLLLFLSPLLILNGHISALYISITKDPATSMGISWFSSFDETEDFIYLQTSDATWDKKVGEQIREENGLVHNVILENLTPDTQYFFRISNRKKIFNFCTAPTDPSQPFNFTIYTEDGKFPTTNQMVIDYIVRRAANLFNDFSSPWASHSTSPLEQFLTQPVKDNFCAVCTTKNR